MTAIAGWLAFLPAAAPADPSRARYSADSTRLFWLVQISDTHIGTEWYSEDTRFFWALNEALGIVQPDLVLNTGDLVDGSLGGMPASGQDEAEWRRYREALDLAGLPADYYIDLVGNHDIYGSDLHYYLQWSFNGSTSGMTTRTMTLEYPFGKYLVYCCATPGESAPSFIDTAAFSRAELDEMQQVLSGASDAALAFVFGHHDPDGPENSDQARALWREYGALYFHGHIHMYDEYMHDGVLVREVDSLGKSTRENLAVIAVDNDWVAYAVADSEDPWPFIVITAPAAALLKNGDANPYAYSVGVDCPQAPVRALVFDHSLDPRVSFRLSGGEAVVMERDPVRPMLYLGTWDTRGLTPGEVPLTVSAQGSQARERTIQVRLDNASCPEAWVPPDGGPDGSDGGDPLPDGETATDADGAPADEASQDGGVPADEGSPAPDSDPTGEEELLPGGGCGCHTGRCPGSVAIVAAWPLFRRRRMGDTNQKQNH